jgi:hypothetical protein
MKLPDWRMRALKLMMADRGYRWLFVIRWSIFALPFVQVQLEMEKAFSQ